MVRLIIWRVTDRPRPERSSLGRRDSRPVRDVFEVAAVKRDGRPRATAGRGCRWGWAHRRRGGEQVVAGVLFQGAFEIGGRGSLLYGAAGDEFLFLLVVNAQECRGVADVLGRLRVLFNEQFQNAQVAADALGSPGSVQR